MSDLRAELLAANEKINWVPDNIKEGRFGEWLREVKDWAISRERYWGTPLPVWQCEGTDCGGRVTAGSLAELEERAPAMPRIFMVRHGEAETNVTDVIISEESRPFSITDKGREQSRKTAAEIKAALGDRQVDAIYCSPLTRTRETAAIIAEALGFDAAKIEYRDELREIGFGEANGKHEAEYYAHFADPMERWAKGTPGGESLTDVRRRTVAFLKEMRERHGGKNVLVVSHGDTLWMAKTGFDGRTNEQVMAKKWYPETGGWFELDNLKNLPYDEQGRVDVHRPFIDEVRLKCEKCGGTMARVKDVMDVWLDSGAMPYAQWHYPFENTERVDGGLNYPADYIAEAIDQTRGWFYTLLAVSVLLGRKEPPYRNVICYNHILDARGKKMSKSKGNMVDPFEAFDRFGADAVRYFLFTVNQPGEYKRFDDKAVDEVTKKVFMILWNVLSFWQMYRNGATTTERPTANLHVLDQWILSELAGLHATVDKGLGEYDVLTAARAIGDFVNDLSTWYVRRSRDRFKSGTPEEKEAAVRTLGYVLLTLSKLMAPFTPFLADALYKETGGALDSVHLDRWPDAADLPAFDGRLREDMAYVRQVVSLGLEQRAAAGIPVRQALAKAVIHSSHACGPWVREIVADELNVHEVIKEEVKGGSIQVILDTVITPELKREGAARELVRRVNDWRKQSGLTIQDRIAIVWQGSDFWQETVAEHGAAVAMGTLCDTMEEGPIPEPAAVELEIDGEKISLKAEKV